MGCLAIGSWSFRCCHSAVSLVPHFRCFQSLAVFVPRVEPQVAVVPEKDPNSKVQEGEEG